MTMWKRISASTCPCHVLLLDGDFEIFKGTFSTLQGFFFYFFRTEKIFGVSKLGDKRLQHHELMIKLISCEDVAI